MNNLSRRHSRGENTFYKRICDWQLHFRIYKTRMQQRCRNIYYLFILFYFILFYFILFYFILFYFILFYFYFYFYYYYYYFILFIYYIAWLRYILEYTKQGYSRDVKIFGVMHKLSFFILDLLNLGGHSSLGISDWGHSTLGSLIP